MWTASSNLVNSSTRCEIGTAMGAMLPPKEVNIGVVNLATVKKGTAIINHIKKQQDFQKKDEKGRLNLGGVSTPLHRDSPWKKRWELMKDGDLWKQFANMVKAKSATAIKLTKVKGHATDREVLRGEVASEEKEGNGEADDAADKGVKDTQGCLETWANIYNDRQNKYSAFVERGQWYIIQRRRQAFTQRKAEAPRPFRPKGNQQGRHR